MLPRKRKRLAQNTIKFAAQEEERLERGKIVDQAKQDLKQPDKLSRKQRRAAEKVIAQAAEEKKLLRIKRREERAAEELERIRIDKIQTDIAAEEEEERHPEAVHAHEKQRQQIAAPCVMHGPWNGKEAQRGMQRNPQQHGEAAEGVEIGASLRHGADGFWQGVGIEA